MRPEDLDAQPGHRDTRTPWPRPSSATRSSSSGSTSGPSSCRRCSSPSGSAARWRRWRRSTTPALQAWFVRTRGAVGVRIVGLREARRALLEALREGTSVGPRRRPRPDRRRDPRRPSSGRRRRCPSARPCSASRAARRPYVVGVRRGAAGSYGGRLERVAVPAEGTRRERVTATTDGLARAFERVIEDAPEQWWAVFFPIWPDLEAEAEAAGPRRVTDRERRPRRPAHPHRRLRRDGRRRGHPRPRRAPGRPRRHRHHRPRAHRRRPGRAVDGASTRASPSRSSSARRSRRSAATCWPCSWSGRSGPTARCARRSSTSTTPAAWPSRPIRSCPTRCAPRAGSCAGCSTTAIRPPARTPLETFNPTALGRPWHDRVVRFADRHGLPGVGNSDAHALAAIGTGWTTFEGRTAADLRRAIETGDDPPGGAFHGTTGQLGVFGQQLRKRAVDARDEVRGRVRRDGTGRDHGYPRRPARRAAAADRADGRPRPTDEDRPRLPVHLPGERAASPSTSGSCTRTSGCAATTSGSSPPATARSARRRATSSASASGFSVPDQRARSGRSPSRPAT